MRTPPPRLGRRAVIAVLGAAMASPRGAGAQQAARPWRLGVLDWYSESDRVIYDGLIEALREIGYAEGRNLTIDYRGADGDPQRAARFAAELASSRVDLIVPSLLGRSGFDLSGSSTMVVNH